MIYAKYFIDSIDLDMLNGLQVVSIGRSCDLVGQIRIFENPFCSFHKTIFCAIEKISYLVEINIPVVTYDIVNV
jgi:hypothetical protein